MLNDKKQYTEDELVEMLDKMMSEGTGHVNIVANDESSNIEISTVKSNDCSKNTACMQPNEKAPDEDNQNLES